MSAIWASLGETPPAAVLQVVPHRGRHVTKTEISTSAGALHLWQADAAASNGVARTVDGRFVGVFDGVLYNREQLAIELALPEKTDAELALGAIARFGCEGARHLDGAFALIVFDAHEARLHAIRDRFGLRPLYIADDAAGLAIASEVKQLLARPGATARLNPVGALDFLLHGLTDHAPHSQFADVWRLPAATRFTLELSSPRRAKPTDLFTRWYELPEPGSRQLSADAAVRAYQRLLSDAVENAWQQPGSRALCLSGGLDSASLAGLLTRQRAQGEPLLALKARFGDERYDEPELFDAVVAGCGARAVETLTNAESIFGDLEALVWHMDEPFARASLAAQWRLFSRANELGIDSVLDGQGADEQLGGYLSMVEEHQRYLGAGAAADTPPPRATTRAVDDRQLHLAAFAGRFRSFAEARFTAAKPQPPKRLSALCRERVYVGDLPMMMRHNDRIASAFGITPHVPFMSNALVELAIGLGDEHKLEGTRTKMLLRRAVSGLVPERVLRHFHKGSYSELEAGWFRGAAGAPLRQRALGAARRYPELFSETGVSALLEDFGVADKETLMLAWRIACFGIWAERFHVSVGAP